ncbi:unnamed protein product [Lampetra planeri]
MAALLPDPLLEARDQARAPLKDFCQIVVTRSEVNEGGGDCVHSGDVDGAGDGGSGGAAVSALRNELAIRVQFPLTANTGGGRSLCVTWVGAQDPGRRKRLTRSFWRTESCRAACSPCLGPSCCREPRTRARGRHDFLSRLPAPLGVRVLALLRLEDLQSVARTCTRLHALCESDALWEAVCCGCNGSCSSSSSSHRESLRALAADIGWKKVFFSSKLHLQLQLRRRRQRNDNSDINDAQQQLALLAPEAVPAN